MVLHPLLARLGLGRDAPRCSALPTGRYSRIEIPLLAVYRDKNQKVGGDGWQFTPFRGWATGITLSY